MPDVLVSERCYLCQMCQCQDGATVSGVSVSGRCYLCQVCQCQNGVSCKDGCVAVCDDGHYGLECAFATLPVSGVSVSKRCYLRKMVVLQRVLGGLTVWAVHRCVGVSTVLPVTQRLDSATVRQG